MTSAPAELRTLRPYRQRFPVLRLIPTSRHASLLPSPERSAAHTAAASQPEPRPPALASEPALQPPKPRWCCNISWNPPVHTGASSDVRAHARSSPSADTSFPRCGFGGASRELLALERKHERAGGRVSVPTRLKDARVTRRRRQAEVRFGPAGSSALARRRSCDCAELLCGCALPCAGVAPVAAGGEPTMARERAGERGFGAVADGGRDRGDDVVGVLLLDAAWEPVVGDHAGAVA